MEMLYIILLFIIVGLIIGIVLTGLWYALPYILVIAGAIYLYNRFIRKNRTRTYEQEESYYETYTHDTNVSNPDVIDVEYTEYEDTEEA